MPLYDIRVRFTLVREEGSTMKEWSKKQKIMLAAVFAAILAVAGIAAGVLNYRAIQEGRKTFQVEVVSERDDYYQIGEYSTEEEYLGAYMRTYEGCEWEESDYGIYIKGFNGRSEDIDNQYWWCVMVNGESATTGADEIPLQDGDTYSFVLMQGW